MMMMVMTTMLMMTMVTMVVVEATTMLMDMKIRLLTICER